MRQLGELVVPGVGDGLVERTLSDAFRRLLETPDPPGVKGSRHAAERERDRERHDRGVAQPPLDHVHRGERVGE
jgi:hypothetical protein